MTPIVPSIRNRVSRHAVACPDHPWVPELARTITESRLSGAKLPLLLTLCLVANVRSGRVLIERRTLSELVALEEPTLESWLHEFEAGGLITLRSKGTYLVLFVRMWRSETLGGDTAEPQKTASVSDKQGRSAPPSTPPPVSALPLKNSAESAEQNRAEQGDGVRGVGSEEEGLDAFLDRLVKVVGAPDERSSYRAFCRKYPRPVLEEALARVAAAGNIRKSRGALFTYLVKKLA